MSEAIGQTDAVDGAPAQGRDRALSGQLFAARLVEMKDFRDLKVWQKAHQLALALFRATAEFRAPSSTA